MTSRRVVEKFYRYRETRCVQHYSALKMKRACSFESFKHLYQTRRHHTLQFSIIITWASQLRKTEMYQPKFHHLSQMHQTGLSSVENGRPSAFSALDMDRWPLTLLCQLLHTHFACTVSCGLILKPKRKHLATSRCSRRLIPNGRTLRFCTAQWMKLAGFNFSKGGKVLPPPSGWLNWFRSILRWLGRSN